MVETKSKVNSDSNWKKIHPAIWLVILISFMVLSYLIIKNSKNSQPIDSEINPTINPETIENVNINSSEFVEDGIREYEGENKNSGLLVLASLKSDEGKYDEALEIYFEIEQAEDNPDYTLYSAIAGAAELKGDVNLAIEYMQKAVAELEAENDAQIADFYKKQLLRLEGLR